MISGAHKAALRECRTLEGVPAWNLFHLRGELSPMQPFAISAEDATAALNEMLCSGEVLELPSASLRWFRFRDFYNATRPAVQEMWWTKIMRKLIPALSLMLLLAFSAQAQKTTVNATIVDPGGIPYANGTVNAQLIPAGVISTVNGAQIGGFVGPAVTDDNGHFSMDLFSNPSINPTSTQWVFTICNPGVPSPLGFGNVCFTSPGITISGATLDLSTTLNALAPALTRLSGSPTTFPTLDQVLNPNKSKAFDLGSNFLSFFNGPFNLSGATSFSIPNSAGATASSAAQLALDTTFLNIHCWNGADAICLALPATSTFNNGDVLGLAVAAGQIQGQDLGGVNSTNGSSFLEMFNTGLLDGDVHCYDSTATDPLQAWPNCTPGAVDTGITGATSTYLISLADNSTTIDHDSAGSVSVTVTLPTADTLGVNPGFVFVYSNHSTHADSIAPTTWTINGAATLSVAANTFCKTRVDPSSATNWLADCATSGGGSLPASAGVLGTNGSGVGIAATSHGVSSVRTCVAASASGTAYTCSTTPTFTPAAGDELFLKADVANTGATTLNVDSSSAAPVKKQGGGTALVANDFLAGQWIDLIYDGTNWQMQGQTGNAAAGGSGSSTLITETVTSGSASSVTFSSIVGTYRDLVVKVRGRGDTAAVDVRVQVQFNADTGANYIYQRSWASVSATGADSGTGLTSIYVGQIAAASASAGFSGATQLTIFDYRGTAFDKSTLSQGGDSALFVSTFYGQWNSTAAITSIKVFPLSGNFVDGSIVSLYGSL